MLEIIKVIGLEEYLEFTNEFYIKFKKRIENLKNNYEISYTREEFFYLMKYILRKKIKNDNEFLKEMKINLDKNHEKDAFINLKNFINFYYEESYEEIKNTLKIKENIPKENEYNDNNILYDFYKNKKI